VQQDQSIESRRVRFESIEGLQRRDIGLAGEVWLQDICESKWATREAMKLAAHLVRYMAAADLRQIAVSRIEHQIGLTRDEIQFALRQMRLFRAVEAYSTNGDELRVALHLSTLQRLRVLEARHRLEYLMRQTAPHPGVPPAGQRWLPPEQEDEVPAASESVA
jgi:hypothetical protein